MLGANDGDLVRLSHSPPVDSLSHLRAKVYGEKLLGPAAIESIIRDIVAGRYSDIDLAAFVTAFAGPRRDADETTALTRAMIDTGERLYWGQSPIVDKHCVGGLPGNRTSMIVVPIVAACGLTIPKTSSRAITSPAGTADAMETIAPVDLDLEQMRRVVEREGACIVWGGRVRLAPADDVIISVERPLDFDSPAQLVASILSKKAAAGSTHVVIDMPDRPDGEGAFRSRGLTSRGAASDTVARLASACRCESCAPTARSPSGAASARRSRRVTCSTCCAGMSDAPADLRERALSLAGEVLEIGGARRAGCGVRRATEVLDDGRRRAKIRGDLRGAGRNARAAGGAAHPRRHRDARGAASPGSTIAASRASRNSPARRAPRARASSCTRDWAQRSPRVNRC